MNPHVSSISGNLDKKMHPEQFDQVVEAIIAGKYSWACVLMLRFVGYNPLHYIPYRTYNRLLKENSRLSRTHSQHSENITVVKQVAEKTSDHHLAPSCLSKIKDLAYLDVVGKQKVEVCSSNINQQMVKQIPESQAIKSPLNSGNTPDISLKYRDFI